MADVIKNKIKFAVSALSLIKVTYQTPHIYAYIWDNILWKKTHTKIFIFVTFYFVSCDTT